MIKKLWNQYRSVLSYLFFGVCTTLINIAVYYFCSHTAHLGVTTSTLTAWLLAVIFAFLTNKAWVFDSRSWEKNTVLKELSSFFLCRIATGILDLGIMLVTVDLLHWNDVVMKTISNVAVILLNYIASKLVIFRRH